MLYSGGCTSLIPTLWRVESLYSILTYKSNIWSYNYWNFLFPNFIQVLIIGKSVFLPLITFSSAYRLHKIACDYRFEKSNNDTDTPFILLLFLFYFANEMYLKNMELPFYLIPFLPFDPNCSILRKMPSSFLLSPNSNWTQKSHRFLCLNKCSKIQETRIFYIHLYFRFLLLLFLCFRSDQRVFWPDLNLFLFPHGLNLIYQRKKMRFFVRRCISFLMGMLFIVVFIKWVLPFPILTLFAWFL